MHRELNINCALPPFMSAKLGAAILFRGIVTASPSSAVQTPEMATRKPTEGQYRE